MSEEIIIDNFRLGNCIATGSTSQIYEAFDQETNERYAMKLLLDEAFKLSENKTILKREFKIASGLDHPNCMPVFFHRQTRKNAYIIMELFGGANLKQIIRGENVVIHSRFRKMLECVLMGLSHIHEKGWLHRDIKPDNIMMTKGTDVRIIDFSLTSRIPSAVAKMLSGKTKQIQGTRTYIAPEIVRRKHPGITSDIYSLGVTAFECLTGRPPFMGSSPNDLLIKHIQEAPPQPSTFNRNVTPEMDKLISRMLAKRPENRPQTCSDLLSEFRNVKIFHEEPEAYAKAKAEEAEKNVSFADESALDSRADAERQQNRPKETQAAPAPISVAPKTPAQATAPKPAASSSASNVQPKAPTHGTPPQRPPQPGNPPVYAQPPQQAPYYPGAPMPAQAPGWGQSPPVSAPPVASQQPTRPVPPARQPAAARPQTPAKPVAPPPQKKSPPPQKPEEDIPFADELPDIS